MEINKPAFEVRVLPWGMIELMSLTPAPARDMKETPTGVPWTMVIHQLILSIQKSLSASDTSAVLSSSWSSWSSYHLFIPSVLYLLNSRWQCTSYYFLHLFSPQRQPCELGLRENVWTKVTQLSFLPKEVLQFTVSCFLGQHLILPFLRILLCFLKQVRFCSFLSPW